MWLESTYIVSDTLTCFPLAAWCVNNGHNDHNNTLQIEGCFSLQKIFSLRYSFISAQIILVIPFFFAFSLIWFMCTKFMFKEDLYLRFPQLMNITVSNYFMCINMWSSVMINISKYLEAWKDYSKMNCVNWSWIPFSCVRQAHKVKLWTIISLVFLICTEQLHG